MAPHRLPHFSHKTDLPALMGGGTMVASNRYNWCDARPLRTESPSVRERADAGVGIGMSKDTTWSLLFSIAIAVLMAAILMIREDPVPTWVLIVYPAVGAVLANMASRTSPTVDGIAWIETGMIAAAAIVILAALINFLLIELLLREIISGEFLSGTAFQKFSFYALPAISALLWWSLERRLTRMRKAGRRVAELPKAEESTERMAHSDTLA